MPTFRTAPSGDLTAAVRRLVASGGSAVTPLQEMQVDQAAATTAQHMGLAEKARAEAEAIQRAGAMRADPAARTEFAAHSAGMDLPDANRMMGAIRGQLEQPGPGDVDDAMVVGREAQPYVMGKPNVAPGQERVFRSALAATMANLLATGHTNADQLTQATGNVQGQGITEAVQRAIAEGDADKASAMNQGGKLGTQIKVFDNVGSTGATFAPGSGKVNASPTADPNNALLGGTVAELAAKKAKELAAADASRAAAEKSRKEKPDGEKAPQGFRWGEPDAQGNATLVPIAGGPATAKAQSSDAERVSAGYASRMQSSAKILGKLEEKNVGKPEFWETVAGATPVGGKASANIAMSPERQQYRQAQEDWVRAKLRKESGAVIGEEEMDREIRVYFPQIGDTSTTIKQKADSRRTAEAAMVQAAGRAHVAQPAAGGDEPKGEVQARKKIGNVEFVKIGGKWFQP